MRVPAGTRGRTLRRAIVGAAASFVLLGATDATAAQRFASPSGTGSSCTAPSPCAINEAISNAGAGDEVIVADGSYPGAGSLFSAAANLDVHAASGAHPKVTTTSSIALQLTGAGSTISGLSIETTNNSGIALFLNGNV